MRKASPLLVVLGALALTECNTDRGGGPLVVEECPIGCIARVGQYPRSAFEEGEELVRGELGGTEFRFDADFELDQPVLILNIDAVGIDFEQRLTPDALDDLGIEIVPSGETFIVKLQEDLTVQGLLQLVTGQPEPPQDPALQNAIRSAVCALAPQGVLRREFPTTAQLVIQTPTASGSGELSGTAEVNIALPARWRPSDLDGDGLEEAVPIFATSVIRLSRSEFVFSLQAVIPNLGQVNLKQGDPGRHLAGPSQLVIEEMTNNQTGTLEQPVVITLKNVVTELTIDDVHLHSHGADFDTVVSPQTRSVTFLATPVEVLYFDEDEQPAGKIRAAKSQSGCGVARFEQFGGTTVQRLLAVLTVWSPLGILLILRRRARRRAGLP